MSDCVFCKIAAGEIPTELVYEDDQIVAFQDVSPQAPVHILLIPRRHLATLDEAGEDQGPLLGSILLTAARIAREKGIAEKGYRVLTNCNAEGGQVVFHLHFHLLGGRQMMGLG
jgi:histidine triad (HIT) family protein